MTRYWILTCSILLLFGCRNKLGEVKDLFDYPDPDIEVIEKIAITYSDSGRLRATIHAPLMHRQAEVVNGVDIFPEGVQATFYDHNRVAESWMYGDYGENRRNQSEVYISGNVHLFNDEGDTLKAEDLLWDQDKKELRTNKYVNILSQGQLLHGFGFRAEEDFSEWEINALKGIVDIDNQ